MGRMPGSSVENVEILQELLESKKHPVSSADPSDTSVTSGFCIAYFLGVL